MFIQPQNFTKTENLDKLVGFLEVRGVKRQKSKQISNFRACGPQLDGP
jgi:hypothetical protein